MTNKELRAELAGLVKPCKCCGARPSIHKVSVGEVVHGHYVRCRPCNLTSANGGSYRDAVARWNKDQKIWIKSSAPYSRG